MLGEVVCATYPRHVYKIENVDITKLFYDTEQRPVAWTRPTTDGKRKYFSTEEAQFARDLLDDVARLLSDTAGNDEIAKFSRPTMCQPAVLQATMKKLQTALKKLDCDVTAVTVD